MSEWNQQRNFHQSQNNMHPEQQFSNITHSTKYISKDFHEKPSPIITKDIDMDGYIDLHSARQNANIGSMVERNIGDIDDYDKKVGITSGIDANGLALDSFPSIAHTLIYYKIQLLSLTNLPELNSSPPHYFQLSIGDKIQELYITEKFQSKNDFSNENASSIHFNENHDIIIELKVQGPQQPQYMYFSIYIDGQRENRVKLQVEKYVTSSRMRNIEFVLLIRNTQSKLKLRMKRENEIIQNENKIINSHNVQYSNDNMNNLNNYNSINNINNINNIKNSVTPGNNFNNINNPVIPVNNLINNNTNLNNTLNRSRDKSSPMLDASPIQFDNDLIGNFSPISNHFLLNQSDYSSLKMNEVENLLHQASDMFPIDNNITSSFDNMTKYPQNEIPNSKIDIQSNLISAINQQRAYIKHLESENIKVLQQKDNKITELEQKLRYSNFSGSSLPSSRPSSPVSSRASSPRGIRGGSERGQSPSRLTKGRSIITSSTEYQSLLENRKILEEEKKFLSKQLQKLKSQLTTAKEKFDFELNDVKKEKFAMEDALKNMQIQFQNLQSIRETEINKNLEYKKRIEELANLCEELSESNPTLEETIPLISNKLFKGISELNTILNDTFQSNHEDTTIIGYESESPLKKLDKLDKGNLNWKTEKKKLEKTVITLQKEKVMLLKKLHQSDVNNDSNINSLDKQLKILSKEKKMINDEINKIFTTFGGSIDTYQKAIQDEIDAILLFLSSKTSSEGEHLNQFTNLTLLIQKQFSQYEDTLRLIIHKYSGELGIQPNWKKSHENEVSNDFWQEVKALKEAIRGQDFKSVDLHRQAKEIKDLTSQLESQSQLIEQLKSENLTLNSKVNRLSKNETSLSKAKEYSYKELHDTQDKVRELEKEIQTIKEKNSTLLKQCKDLTMINVNLKDSKEKISEEIQRIGDEKLEIEYRLEDMKSDNERLKHNLEARDLELEELLAIVENLKQRMESTESGKDDQIKNLQKEITLLNKEKAQLKERIDNYQNNLDSITQNLQREVSALQTDNNRLKDIIKELNYRQDTLTHELALEKQQLIKEFNGKISTQSSEHKSETYSLHLKIKQYQELLGEMEQKIREQARKTSSSLPQDEYNKLKESYESEIRMLHDQISDIDQIHKDEMTIYKSEVEKEIRILKKEIDSLKNERDSLLEKIRKTPGRLPSSSNLNDLNDFKTKFENSQSELQTVKLENLTLEKEKLDLQIIVKNLELDLNNLKNKSNQVESDDNSNHQKIDYSDKSIQSEENQEDISNVKVLEDLLKQKNELIQILERNSRTLKQENENLIIEIERIEKDNLLTNNEERKELMEKLDAQQILLEQCKNDLDDRIAFNSTLSRENMSLQESIKFINSENTKLNKELVEISIIRDNLIDQINKINQIHEQEVNDVNKMDFKVTMLEQLILEKDSEIKTLKERIELMKFELSSKNEKILNLQTPTVVNQIDNQNKNQNINQIEKSNQDYNIEQNSTTADSINNDPLIPQMLTRKPSSLEHVSSNIANILLEFISTEQKYIYSLNLLNHYYIQPIKENEILSESKFKSIFQHLDSIRMVNSLFFTEIQKFLVNEGNIENPSFTKQDYSNFVKCLIQIMPSFKLYTSYIQYYSQAIEILKNNIKKNDRLNNFLQSQIPKLKALQVRSPSIQSLMAAPVQRIPRYRLLLLDLKKKTSSDEDISKSLEIALQTIDSVAQMCDDKVYEAELAQRFLEICIMYDLKHLVEPGRKMVAEMDSGIKTENGWIYCELFICSDLIILIKKFKDSKKHDITILKIPFIKMEVTSEHNISIEGARAFAPLNEMLSQVGLLALVNIANVSGIQLQPNQTGEVFEFKFATTVKRDEFKEIIDTVSSKMEKSIK